MKKSFLLYLDMADPIEMLSDAEAGRLMKAVFRYASTGALPEELKAPANICFQFIRRSLDRDQEKYERTCAARAKAGRRGGTCSQERRKQMKAIASFAQANQADNENDSENDNENGNENDNDNENENMPAYSWPEGAESSPSLSFSGKYRNLSFLPEGFKIPDPQEICPAG